MNNDNDENDNDDNVNNDDDDDDDAADRKLFELKARKKGDQDFWVRKLILEDGEKKLIYKNEATHKISRPW